MKSTTKETFFLPNEVARTKWSVPAETYNLYRALLKRCTAGHVFIPIRNVQFMGILDKSEIVFVDSQSYAYSKDEGGRLIMIAWQFSSSQDRDALNQPMPCDVVFYGNKNRDLQRRLIVEFKKSMELLDERYRDKQLPARGAKILTL